VNNLNFKQNIMKLQKELKGKKIKNLSKIKGGTGIDKSKVKKHK